MEGEKTFRENTMFGKRAGLLQSPETVCVPGYLIIFYLALHSASFIFLSLTVHQDDKQLAGRDCDVGID